LAGRIKADLIVPLRQSLRERLGREQSGNIVPAHNLTIGSDRRSADGVPAIWRHRVPGRRWRI